MNRTELNQVLRKTEEGMTKLFKAEIKRQKLIKTGRMYATTICKLINKRDGLAFEVRSTEYFVFVDGNYKITKNVMKSQGWKTLQKQLIKAYSSYCKSEIIRLSK